MLYGILVVDGNSYELIDWYKRAVPDLDEAAGQEIDIRCIGDPGQSGEIYRSTCTPALRESDALDANYYVEHIYRTGREDSHRLTALKQVRDDLALQCGDVPCLVFLTQTGTQPAGLLRIHTRWYDSRPAERAFDRCLRAWLSRADVKKLATASLGESEVAAQLGSSLAALTTEIENAIGPSLQGSTSPNRTKGMVHFNTPAGATWPDVEIKFVDGHTVSVNALGERGRFSYTQMGMVDGRTVNPTQQWKLLEAFAYRRGRLTWEDSEATRKNQKRRERLAHDLCAFFRIEGDPFCLTDDQKGWRARFSISLE